MDLITITYYFDFDQKSSKKYEIKIDSNTLGLIKTPIKNPPEWTALDFHQCDHCPLKKEESPQCPVALNLAQIVEQFKDEKSYRKTKVGVVTKERTYVKSVGMQEGLFSVFGLIMATSECPHMNFLRPLARFHLPFANSEETIVRTLSFYLLKMYLDNRDKEEIQISFKDLEESYEKVVKVNRGIIERIRSIIKGDAEANAVVILDSFAGLLSFEISNDFSEVQELFKFKT